MLSQRKAYDAAYLFLVNRLTERQLADDYDDMQSDLLFIVSNMNRNVWADGSSADPDYEYKWADAALKKESLTAQEAFDTMLRFIEMYIELGEIGTTHEITKMLENLRAHADATWHDWRKCIQQVQETSN